MILEGLRDLVQTSPGPLHYHYHAKEGLAAPPNVGHVDKTDTGSHKNDITPDGQYLLDWR